MKNWKVTRFGHVPGEKTLKKDVLLRGNITETNEQSQNHQLSLLADQLKQLIRAEVLVR